ncbi:coagulation factor XII [Pelodytes ibericus]
MNLSCLLSLLAILVIAQAKPKHREKKRHKAGLVLTESGDLCHFPFVYGRMEYHKCIRRGKQGPKPWCSLTRNYDRDHKWSYCIEGHDVKDNCEDNQCENRGVCESKIKGYRCICEEPYTGLHCQTDKCFDKKLQQYFEPREKWLRYSPPILEECTCSGKGSTCKTITGKACAKNPCLNGGHCIQKGKDNVCGCIKGYIGAHCEIRPAEVCYRGNGTSYRGTANVTMTGLPCLSWDSEVIHHEVSRYSGENAKDHGIGPHPYCRNPDGDKEPWCFVLLDDRLSWEHCLIPKCSVITASTSSPKINKTQSLTQSPKQSTTPSITQLPKQSTPPSTTQSPKQSTTQSPKQSTTQGSNSLTLSSTKNYDPPSNPTNQLDGYKGMPTSCEKKFQKVPSISPRIVGGLVALPASHPYMAALYISSHFCGGALLSSCWILTAAHCLEHGPDLNEITVVLGQSLFNTTDKRTSTFRVQKYILHAKFDQETFQHDIALVRLQSTADICAEFTQFVQPVCLPQNLKVAKTAKQCAVVGWGHQYYEADDYALFLQEAYIQIFSDAQCRSPIVHGTKILTGMMCAGVMAGGVDACQGDSGGPLVCELDGSVELHGIVSWGTGCGEENKPGVYTDVSNYINWILSNMS